MTKILKTARWEFTEKVRSKSFLISSLLVPIVLLSFILIPDYLIPNEINAPAQIGLLDETGWFADSLPENLSKKYHLSDGRPEMTVIPVADAKIGEHLVGNGILDALVVIEPGSQERDVRFVFFSGGHLKRPVAEKIQIELRMLNLERILARNVAVDQDIKNALDHEIVAEIKSVKNPSRGTDESRYLAGMIAMVLLFLSIFTSTGYFLRGVAEEKTNRVIELLVSSMTPIELIAGKILGLGLLGLLQIGFWLTISFVVGREHLALIFSQGNVAIFFLYFVLGYLLFASVSAGIGSIVSSSDEIQQMNSLVSLLGIIPIAFAIVVLKDPNSTLVNILSYVPLLTPTLMILRIAISEPPAVHVAGTLAVLSVSVVYFVWFSGKVFQTGVLMHGKRVSIREIFKQFKN